MFEEEINAVGYKKPPKNTRFQKGRSGNPGGRPRGTQPLSAAIETALGQEVSGTLDGKQKKVPMSDIIAMKLVHKAAAGNIAPVAMVDKIQSRAQLAKKNHEASDDGVPVFNVRMDFDEGPVCPPDMWRLCEEMEREQQGVPPQFEPNYRLAKLVMEHLRKTEHLLPDALKYLTK